MLRCVSLCAVKDGNQILSFRVVADARKNKRPILLLSPNRSSVGLARCARRTLGIAQRGTDCRRVSIGSSPKSTFIGSLFGVVTEVIN